MNFEVDHLVNCLRALGEPNRLRILALLMRGEMAVGELAQVMEQSQPRLSHHLKALTAANLVERMPEGAWVFYSVPATGNIRIFLDSVLTQVDFEAGEFADDARRLDYVRKARTAAAEDYFGEIAETWDTVQGLQSPRAEIEIAFLEMAGPGPFDRVIDIGTGTGRMLTLFAPHAKRLDGIDLSHRMLTVARANLDRADVDNAHIRQGNAASLPFEDKCADLVVIHQVLHFLDEPERVIAEAGRVLKTGGQLLIADFAPHRLEFLRSNHGHRRLGIRDEALGEWSERAGLIIDQTRAFAHPESLAEGLTVKLWSLTRQDKDPV